MIWVIENKKHVLFSSLEYKNSTVKMDQCFKVVYVTVDLSGEVVLEEIEAPEVFWVGILVVVGGGIGGSPLRPLGAMVPPQYFYI